MNQKKLAESKLPENPSENLDAISDDSLSTGDIGKSSQKNETGTSDKEEGVKVDIGERIAPGLRITILILICCIAVSSRVFAVVGYESIIHEFDPWFNYRSTEYLLENGWYKFRYWTDHSSWYPIGRYTGATLYPGLMVTAWIMHGLLHGLFLIPIHIREVCVFTAPIFSCLTAFATYGLACEVGGRTEAGLIAALLVSIMPTYMSRSVAGSYDNEAVAIFALVCAFYTYARSLRIGSLMSALIAVFGYYYMVLTWGGYVFVLGFFSMYTIALALLERLDIKAYITFSMVYLIGSILSLTIPFVGPYAIWESSEHMPSHLAFAVCQLYMIKSFLKKNLSDKSFRVLSILLLQTAGISVIGILVYALAMGKASVGHRIVALINPVYAKKANPLTASVSEHQSGTWMNSYVDIHYSIVLGPLGVLAMYKKLKVSNAALFGVLYCLISQYFASVMIRLKMVAGPGCCVLAGIGASYCLRAMSKSMKGFFKFIYHIAAADRVKAWSARTRMKVPIELAFILVPLICFVLARAVWHGSKQAHAYSHPSIVTSYKNNGRRIMIDDYREAYSWLRTNTHPEDVILSWWDYGYQIAGMANRTTIVDNNTWNHTHIGKAGMVDLIDIDTGL